MGSAERTCHLLLHILQENTKKSLEIRITVARSCRKINRQEVKTIVNNLHGTILLKMLVKTFSGYCKILRSKFSTNKSCYNPVKKSRLKICEVYLYLISISLYTC